MASFKPTQLPGEREPTIVCEAHAITLSQVEQVNTEEMGKAEFYASFVDSIVTIISQRLVICTYKAIVMSYINNCGSDLTLKPSQPVSLSLLC